ncbi:hypothetical protein KFK09_007238 [Dendrobium nobile]|uniref:Uncharacterized protein n=1 Tax=Dendrobium nobile TaxID=94219 RepID=A0A8T3BVW2_DENNO|nr:hypothetical protein KFK09_007238 [Dendrobium nobile]
MVALTSTATATLMSSAPSAWGGAVPKCLGRNIVEQAAMRFVLEEDVFKFWNSFSLTFY